MVLFDQKKLLSEYKNLLKGPRFRLFTALSMPTAWLAGLKIIQLDDNLCVTSYLGDGDLKIHLRQCIGQYKEWARN